MDIKSPVIWLLMLDSCLMVLGAAAKGGTSRKRVGSITSRRRMRPKQNQNTTSSVIDRLMIDYNRQEPPMKDRPTEVRLGIYVNSFYSISEQTMDYSVSMYLRQAWKDPRLKFDPLDGGKTDKIRMGEGRWDSIWTPDTFFRNEKRADFHGITVPNRLLTLNATGYLWYVTKISATLSCPMKLQKYPLDTQMCPIMFESFGYTMDTMYFNWLDSPVDVDPVVQLPQFTLTDIILYDCSQNYTAGAFPCLEIRFVLRRDIGYFLIQVYMPSILIVILSWVAFWINIDAIPARVSLGLLTVLTMTTQSAGARGSLPRVSYIKAIDVWMSVCLIFVFASLLEFAVVNVMSRKEVRTIKPVRRPPPLPNANRNRDLDPDSQLDQVHSRFVRYIGAGQSLSDRPALCSGAKHFLSKVSLSSQFPLSFQFFGVKLSLFCLFSRHSVINKNSIVYFYTFRHMFTIVFTLKK